MAPKTPILAWQNKEATPQARCCDTSSYVVFGSDLEHETHNLQYLLDTMPE